jgi:hypothetical protein
MTEKELYPSIDDLMNAKEISIRTGNCCKISGMESFYDILVKYENEELKIEGAGSKTYLELNWLYESMTSTFPLRNRSPLDAYESEKIMKYYKSLLSNKFKCNAIHEKYKQLTHSYSIRAQIWLTRIPLDIFMSEYLCFYDVKSLKVRHFFVNTLQETTDLKEKLKAEITRQFYMSEEDCVREEIRNHYGLSGNIDFPVSYYMKHRCYPMFWILEKQLEKQPENYNDRDFEILKKTFEIYQNQQPVSLNEFAAQYSISRERVRQIREQLLRTIFSRRSLFFNKYRNDWNHYKPLNKDAIWEQDMQKYIDDEQSNFSPKFILQILSNLLYHDDYTLYGGLYASAARNSWKNAFIVNNNFSEIFDFDKFRAEFRIKLQKNKLPHLLNPVSYVIKCKCWEKYCANKKYAIAGIATDILRYEFNMNPDENGCFTIPVKIKRSMFDVVYEILKDNGNPMHINSIFVEFKKREPKHHYRNPAQLRYYLLKHKAIACQNRRSVYVLKEWSHVKSGTIRDSIVELLTKKRLPQTVQTIAEYVKQYFPETNTVSIRTSMFNDTKKRFMFFRNDLFGLSRKKYPPKYEPADNALLSFDQRLSEVEKFLVENGRFPFASSKNRDERILGVWWTRIIKGIYDTDESKQNEIERIRTQYAGCDENKRIFQWNENCERMKRFLLENHKTPTISTDKFLYHWLGRAKTDYLEHRLNEMQQQKYLELIELM